MSISLLIILVFQCFMFVAIYILWVKFHKPQSDDPRLTRGLQLLQSKIAVLEDLSDRTETQVTQLTALMENKIREIQTKIIDADKVLGQIDMRIHKSLEVAKIFQDKIPHKEMMEREYTIKYVKAAKLANQGLSTDEISREVDLTPGEIDLILKLNKENLMFAEEALPEWVGNSMNLSETKVDYSSNQWVDFEKAFELPVVDKENLKKLGDKFKEAVTQANDKTQDKIQDKSIDKMVTAKVGFEKVVDKKIIEQKSEEAYNQKGKMVSVKPFEFKRIEQ